MKEWDYRRENILEITLESLMNNYDQTFRLIFEHMRFSELERDVGLEIASQHDLGRMSSKTIEKMSHVSSPRITKWKKYFGRRLKEVFIHKYGDILVNLGYETSNEW
jgi:hypothetical protein